MATPYYSKAEADQKNKETFREVERTVQSISAGEGGKSFATLADAQAVSPAPSNGTVFQVENSGYYVYDSTATGGTKYLKDFVYDLNDQELATIEYGGYVFNTLAEAQALTTKPLDGIGFSVKESTDSENVGEYTFQSTEPNGTKFLRDTSERTPDEFINGRLDIFRAPEDHYTGNVSPYGSRGIGLFQKINKDKFFDTVEIYAASDSPRTYVKIYESTSYSFSNPNAELTVLYEGFHEFTTDATRAEKIKLPTPIKVNKGNYVVILWTGEIAGTVRLNRWDSTLTGAPTGLSPILFNGGGSYPTIFNAAWSKGNTSYLAVPPKLYLKTEFLKSGDVLRNELKNKINPFFDWEQILVSKTIESQSFNLETSTFSGWGCGVGVRSPFNIISLNIRGFDDTALPTQVNVRVRENDYSGAVIGQKVVSINEAFNDKLDVEFDDIVDSSLPLFIEYLTDGKVGFSGINANTDIGQGTTLSRYTSSQNIYGNLENAVSPNNQIVIYFEFLNYDSSKARLTPEGKSKLKQELDNSFIPRINLPDKIIAISGYSQQLFYRGMIEAIDPYEWNIKVYTTLNGNQYPRYYEFTPSTIGTFTWTIKLYDSQNTLVSSNSTVIEVKNPISQPTTVKKTLCFGDSLTAGGVWTGEMIRMLTGTGGTPTALGYNNIELIGTQGSGTNLHEGYGGWTWARFLSTDSPFYNITTSEIDFSNYVSVNGFGTIDYVMILLTWNGQAGQLSEAVDHSTRIQNAKTLLNKLHTQFPDVKVKLMGIPLPSLNGGLGQNYGDADSNYGNYYDLVQTVFGLNLAYQELANDPAYSSWLEFHNVSSQFDNENNMPESDRAVNLRSDKLEKRGTNGVHPNTDGYEQIADVAFRAFNNF